MICFEFKTDQRPFAVKPLYVVGMLLLIPPVASGANVGPLLYEPVERCFSVVPRARNVKQEDVVGDCSGTNLRRIKCPLGCSVFQRRTC